MKIFNIGKSKEPIIILPDRLDSDEILFKASDPEPKKSRRYIGFKLCKPDIKSVKYRVKANPQKTVAASVLVIYILTGFLNLFFTQIHPPKVYFDNPTFPYAEKVGEGVSVLKNYEPIKQTLAAPKENLNIKENSIINSHNDTFGWSVKLLNGSVFMFGQETKKGILPVVEIQNKDKRYISYSPKGFEGFVIPKVKGNIISWEIAKGVTARYTVKNDRVKEDLIVDSKESLKNLSDFSLDFSKDLKSQDLPNGDISFLNKNDQENFIIPAPRIIDSNKKQILGSYSLNGNTLSINFETSDLTFPITVDPVVIDASSYNAATAYGNGRKIIKDAYGNLIAVVAEGSTVNSDAVWYKNSTSSSWTDAGVSFTTAGETPLHATIASDIDSSGNIHSVYFKSNIGGAVLDYVKLTITRDTANLITSISKGTILIIDSSGFGTRPSLIIANKGGGSGVEKVAVAYSMDNTATTRNEIRFMQCDVADDCTTAANWKNASEEINGSGTCSDSVTSGAAGLPNAVACKGTADKLFATATSGDKEHVVLMQMTGRPKRSPASVKKDINGTFSTLSNTVDNNTGTSDNVNSLTTTDYIYVGDNSPFSKTSFDVVNTNINAVNVTTGQYCSAQSGGVCSTWTNFSNLSDTTSDKTNTASLGQDGSLYFDEPANWVTNTVDSVSNKYWARFRPDGAFDSTVSLAEIYLSDRNARSLMIVAGVDSTDDLRVAYTGWDDVNNTSWEKTITAGNGWISDAGGASSTLDNTGGNWTTFTNFPLSGTVDYINNHAYVTYMSGTAVGSSNIAVKTVPNNVSLTAAANWTDTSFPATTEAAGSVMSLVSDGSNIYQFYVLNPGTNSLVYRKCTPSGGGNGNYCDNASDWGSETTFDSGTTLTHPQAVLSKMPGDTIAIDVIYTDTTAPSVKYERQYANNLDKTITTAASTDTAYSCNNGNQVTNAFDVGNVFDSCIFNADGIQHSGVRFPNVTVPQGALVESAYVDVRVTGFGNSNNLNFTIYGDDNNSSASFASSCSTDCIESRSRTTSSTVVNQNFGTATNTYRFDVTSIVQEIVCKGASNSQPCVGNYNKSGSWASGNAMGILFISTETQQNTDMIVDVATIKPYLQINLAPSGTVGKSYSEGLRYPNKADVTNLDHPLSQSEFGAISTDDTNYASVSAELNPTASTSAVPMYMFKVNNSNNSNNYKIDASAVVRTTVPASSKTLHLQVYRGGSTNQWVDVASNNSSAADTDIALTANQISTNLSEYYFNETPGIGSQYAACTTGTANCWVYFRVWQEASGLSGTNQILYGDYFTTTFSAIGPDKIAFSNASRTLQTGACNGSANVFTMELQSGTTPTNPQATTVVRVTSNSPSYTIYSDNTCTTPVANGDFTYSTSENSKSVYIIDLYNSPGNKTLTGTRQSGDTLTTGTQDYTLNPAPAAQIHGGVTIRGGTKLQ